MKHFMKIYLLIVILGMIISASYNRRDWFAGFLCALLVTGLVPNKQR